MAPCGRMRIHTYTCASMTKMLQTPTLPTSLAVLLLLTTCSALQAQSKTSRIKARKLTLYSDWAALVISGSKTKATGILHKHPPRDENGLASAQNLSHQLKQTTEVQQQKAQFIASDEPFLYLGVELTMDLNWKHQIERMTGNLRNKLEALSASYASPRQIEHYLHCHHSQPCLRFCCNPLHSGRPNHLGQHDV